MAVIRRSTVSKEPRGSSLQEMGSDKIRPAGTYTMSRAVQSASACRRRVNRSGQ